MIGWNLLFLTDVLPAAPPEAPPPGGAAAIWRTCWAIAANVIRRAASSGQMELSEPLAGFALGRVAAPDITPAGLAARGWTAESLHTYLGRGIAGPASAFGDMHQVIMLSTRNLTAEDNDALVTFLLGDSPPPPAPFAAGRSGVPRDGGEPVRGEPAMSRLCAGCHGLEGSGIPNTVVALRGNSTLRLAEPRNLLVAMLAGIGRENFPHRASLQAMPGFADKLSDRQAAELANYLRAVWGGQKPDVTAAAVRALR